MKLATYSANFESSYLMKVELSLGILSRLLVQSFKTQSLKAFPGS